MNKPYVAVSIGDLNGIGAEIFLKTHEFVSGFCEPVYFIHEKLLRVVLEKLEFKINTKLHIIEFFCADECKFIRGEKDENNLLVSKFFYKLEDEVKLNFALKPGCIDEKSGAYSFLSFKSASFFVYEGFAEALVTLPIHKKAWQNANIAYKGHTGALGAFFKRKAIMMLGCEELFVGLFTEHVPLSEVSSYIQLENLCEFFCTFYKETGFENIGVLGFNPHAGDFGTIGGKEELIINEALRLSNLFLSYKEQAGLKDEELGILDFIKDERLVKGLDIKVREYFLPQVLVADSAFTPNSLKRCNRLISMYHDLALAPLKALYFEKSVNVSLNLPIIRLSVDHGTAFDIAYKKAGVDTQSYKEAFALALKFIEVKRKNVL